MGFIKEVPYIIWLANVVMDKKANDSWRMCVDFTNLNKVYSKDSYPLPNIDSLINKASAYTILNFCDTFFGYNQILMWERDYLKTAFIIDECVLCYKVMPFGLKNARVTY